MKVRIYRNTSERRWFVGRLPVRQTLVWAGPVFVLVQRGGSTR